MENGNFLHISKLLSPHDNDDDSDQQSSYGPQINCFMPNEFNAFLREEHDLHKGFSCLHLNCRSIKKNIDNFITFLHGLDLNFCAIGVTETWLKCNDPCYNIDGYNFLGNSRQDRRGGGVGAYIRNDFYFVHRSDLDIFSECMECIFIEIKSSSKIVIFSVILVMLFLKHR